MPTLLSLFVLAPDDAAPLAGGAAGMKRSDGGPTAPARILVVEDNRIVARDIQRQLRHVGYEVVGTAVSGEEAVRLALATRPDLVLMDISLEGAMDGIDAARVIGASCPVVFLTAYADDETVYRAGQSAPFGYLLKPFDEIQLRTSIEIALRRHEAENRVRRAASQHAATLASLSDALIATDEAGRVTFLNPAAEALTGWVRADAADRALEEVLGAGLAPSDGPTTIVGRDGRRTRIRHCSALVRDEDGGITGSVLILRELPDEDPVVPALSDGGRGRANQDLLVTMADGISQPLMAIVTNAASCLRWLQAGNMNVEEAFRAVERIVTDGHRVGDLVSNIRTFAQAAPPNLADFDLQETILEAIARLRHEPARIAVSWETAFDLRSRWALGDRGQIAGVLHELVVTGLGALGPSARAGTVAFRTCPDASEGVVVGIATFGASRPDFEPIRPPSPIDCPGLGGIGMAICRSTIEAHGGRLWSGPGTADGTSVYFSLPGATARDHGETHA
ncbi:hybrid sensor histidine kinase/response regulator [Salinarimonas soli]|uniref:histidine kinase n=1 Tax=Salinarimonas soli TaxID=1638099 RepID=A0A5B2VJ87_9HYPH|nr:hybrid sensor histidine kinase/response regulator [Salinarimonas soli]KAA2238267.1 response regulator [Salinarimonas soli]